MSDQPKKQELPPLDVTEKDSIAGQRAHRHSKYGFMGMIGCRERQLLAALSDNEALRADNEAKEAQLAEARRIVSGLISQKEFHKDTSEAKDARIAELEALIPGFVYGKSILVPIGSAGDLVAMNNRAEAADAKLKSVEAVIQGDIKDPWVTLARIREAVKGDK